MNDLFASVKAIPTSEVFRAFYPDVELRRDGSGREKALCPFHDENTPSFTIYENSFWCFGCSAGGSNIDLLLKGNLASSSLEAAKMIVKRFGITVEEKGADNQQPPTLSDYARYTGLPGDFLVKMFKVREISGGLEMPYRDEAGKEVAVRTRYRLKAKDGVKWRKGDPLILYGLWVIKRIKNTERVLLVEGESDIHVLWFNHIPALGVPGANNFKKKWATLFLELPEIAIIQEPDEAGKGFVKDITVALKQAEYKGQVKAVTLPEKDTRDLWLKHGDRFKEELEKAISSAPLLDLESIEIPTKKKKQSVPPELEGRIIHPALHIERGLSSIGVINREDNKNVFSVATSSGGFYLAEDIKDALLVKPIIHPNLVGRWHHIANAPNLSESIALLIQKMRELIWFEDSRWYPVIALWSAGTYLFPVFPAYPYLQLTGEKGSGKTKVQDVLNCVAFNAIKLLDPTPAILFRLVHALRPTLLIDEAEGMNAENVKEIRGIINGGYKKGAVVSRCEGDGQELKFFEAYGPKSLAGIRGLGSVTEDRCITVVMSKPPQEDFRQNMAVNDSDNDWQTIRSGFYRFPLDYGQRILRGIDAPEPPDWLRARERELWLPLLQLASITDDEGGLGAYDDTIGLARESAQERGLTFEAEAILGLLESKLNGQQTLNIYPIELIDGLEESLNRRGKIKPQWVAERLRGLGFKKVGRDKRGVIYEVPVSKVSELWCKYTTPPDCSTPLHHQHSTPA